MDAMNANIHRIVLAIAAIFAALPCVAAAQDSVRWSDMEPYFAPPQEYRGKLGEYRSVMKFDDGSTVRTADDWQRRREEILKHWHATLGKWPKLVDKPRIHYKQHEHVENFTRHEIEIEVARDRFVGPQYLLVPDGKGPFPAVVVPWYNAADSAGLNEKQRGKVDFGYALAKRGFATLCIGAVGSARMPDLNNETLQPLSYLAYVAANGCNLLAALPEVDAKRIGIVGHSFGGKWAMFASCLYERFACAVWVDPGIVWNEKDANANYWEKWYLGYDDSRPADKQRAEGIPSKQNPRTGAYQKLIAEGHDLHELHALMAPRPFLVSGGAQDRPEHWIALNHTLKLNEFLGYKDRVAMTMRDGHTPTKESNGQVYAFFEHFLKEPSQR
jgi:dienelactone hydrolase